MYKKSNEENKQAYINCLQRMTTLSALFNEGNIPYLNYRFHENSFCYSFNAQNAGRADVSIDAIINKVGIGLKTFLHGNGKTLQKIAEFNADLSDILSGETTEEIVQNIAERRNYRLDFTRRLYGLEETIYHLCTRAEGELFIYEVPMSYINLDKIRKIKRKKNILTFEDNLNSYSFNISKSTLYKRFILDKPLKKIAVKRLSKPFDFLQKIKGLNLDEIVETEALNTPGKDFIILPLYSVRDGHPGARSGLNQWNSSGRLRSNFECYIPIPVAIKRHCPGFFLLDLAHTFTVILPNGNEISCKLCQAGLKALMSNPNTDLGEWLLRDLLKIPEGVLVTRELLERAGTDCVKVRKIDYNRYSIDFDQIGGYEDFIESF